MSVMIRTRSRTLRALSLVVSIACFAAAATAATPVDIERKIDALIARMTLEEKLGQMSQAGFPDASRTSSRTRFARAAGARSLRRRHARG